ncbi:multiple sugar transport system permease protein [Deinobacterium chartae]|uniref:Multiple sugar transport system permease protein n=1 Tax=Deinobacterium chartae TaxID=521158 RepID=A0A841HZV9_9DEIO|nr:sugar ABC transporter permease [Deinobacterium chartae]MBB6097275.1 multiple sugar transport system permease protein [Deinobacterium chartae]
MQSLSKTATPVRRRPSWGIVQRRLAPYLFISPFFILFIGFGLFPIVFSAYLSFHEWAPASGLGNMRFVGLENYHFNLTDPWFWKSLANTAWLAVASGLPQHLIAIPLAFALHTGFRRFKNFLSAAYFLPYITSSVAVALIFFTLFATNFGLVNQLLGWLHTVPVIGALFPSEPINWLGRAPYIKPVIAFVVVWRFVGWNLVLYLAGLQAIPRVLYEAAQVDGASTWQQFRYITLPLLRPIMFFAVTLTLIGSFQLFDEPYVMTNGGRTLAEAGQTTAMYMFRTAFEFSEMGTAAAMSWLLFAVIGVLTFINNRVFGRSGLNPDT